MMPVEPTMTIATMLQNNKNTAMPSNQRNSPFRRQLDLTNVLKRTKSTRGKRYLTATTMMDRYIPARSALDVNLISSEIQRAEKQYNDKLKDDERRRRFGNDGDESEVEEDANDDRDNERT